MNRVLLTGVRGEALIVKPLTVTCVWSWRAWTFGLAFPSNCPMVVFLGPLVVWIDVVDDDAPSEPKGT